MISMTGAGRSPWSMFDELASLQEDLNRAFSGVGTEVSRWRREVPLMNIWQSEEGIIVDAELPGVDPAEVEVSVVGDELSLRGKLAESAPAEGEKVYRRERQTGQFARTVQLPFRAEAEKVKAAYKNGILRVTVPRSEEEKPKRVAIQAA